MAMTQEEKRAKRTAYHREWVKNNPEKVKAYMDKYRKTHREQLNEYSRKYYAKDNGKGSLERQRKYWYNKFIAEMQTAE